MKIGKIIILILVITAFGAGVYFKNDVIKIYKGFGKQIQGFEKTDIGKIISEVQKQVLTPIPLNVGGNSEGYLKQVVLTQSKIIEETNLQRKLNGNLVTLVENKKLNETAWEKANDMFLNQYFEHVSPSGIGPGDLAQKHGYEYIIEGENLILGNFSSEKDVLQNWMDSPGHRANILNNRYTEIGVAVVKGMYKGESVWIGVQEFGLPLSLCVKPESYLKNKIDLEKAQLDILYSDINSAKSQIDSVGNSSPAYNQMVDDYNQLVGRYDLLVKEVKEIIAVYNQQVSFFNNCVTGE